MGRKALDMAEQVIGAVLRELGPSQFAIALGNITSHGGALHECQSTDLDFDEDDVKLNLWHAQIDRLKEAGHWLEDPFDEKNKTPSFAKAAENKPSLYDVRELSDLNLSDQTVVKISLIENMVFETVGRRIQILRTGSKKDTVILRGSLLWFLDKLRVVAADDNELLDMFAFIARCIPEKHVTVNFEHHEFTCHPNYERVKCRNLNHERDDEENDAEDCVVYDTTVREFEKFVQEITGCPVRIGSRDGDEISDDDPLRVKDATRTFLKRVFQNMVENDRPVAYLINYLRDSLGREVNTDLPARYVLMGYEMPVATVSAKRRRRTEALR